MLILEPPLVNDNDSNDDDDDNEDADDYVNYYCGK